MPYNKKTTLLRIYLDPPLSTCNIHILLFALIQEIVKVPLPCEGIAFDIFAILRRNIKHTVPKLLRIGKMIYCMLHFTSYQDRTILIVLLLMKFGAIHPLFRGFKTGPFAGYAFSISCVIKRSKYMHKIKLKKR